MNSILAQQSEIRICDFFSNTLIKELSFKTLYTQFLYTLLIYIAQCLYTLYTDNKEKPSFAEMFALCSHGWNKSK